MGSGVPKTLEIKPGTLLIESDHLTALVLWDSWLEGKSVDGGDALFLVLRKTEFLE